MHLPHPTGLCSAIVPQITTLLILTLTSIALTTRAAEPVPITARSREQIELLQQEKASRTPAERKLDSQLLYAWRKQQQKNVAPGIPTWQPSVKFQPDGRVLVDLRADVTDDLLNTIRKGGGQIVNTFPRHQSARVRLSLELAARLAERLDVKSVRPADEATTHTGPITSEGDITHQAGTIRDLYGITGTGIKIGVLSDSVDHLAQSQATGELPNINIIPGQAGGGSGEGTAMLEIVHDLAPGSDLYFATAFAGQASFADNIRQLFAAGCRVIIDDVTYFAESPFQDGVIAQAVSEVSSNGALYFSSAGNWGNKNDGTASVWEGDFLDGGPAAIGRGGRLHDFGDGTTFNTVLGGSALNRVDLFWSDPLGASTNDYDVYLLDAEGNVAAASSNVQDGDDNPYESIALASPGQRVVVVKHSGEGRFLFLSNGRSRLEFSTSGSVRGHNASGASNAFSVAATWVRSPAIPFTGGTTNPVELFNGDGPRRMFFEADGTPITPGNFSSTGGLALQKPDITAADGGRTSVPGFAAFFGTSAAAPHAGAIAALLWSATPQLTPGIIREAFTISALDIEEPGIDRDSGIGIIMAPAAFEFSSAPYPRVVFEGALLTDANTNGTLEINECGDIAVTLRNAVAPSGTTAIDVRAALRSSTPGVLVDPAPQLFGNLFPGTSATNPLPFRVSTTPSFICNRPAEFELVITSSNGTTTIVPFQIQPTAPGVGNPQVFASSDTPLVIPDLSTNESIIVISNLVQPLLNVRVSLHIAHSFDSDLQLSLVGPDGTTIDLSSVNGGSGANYGTSCLARTVFDDAASNSIVTGIAPFVGAFRPEQTFAVFQGKTDSAVSGPWRLRIQDIAPEDSGILECWSLELTPIQCSVGTGQCLLPPSITAQPQSITATNGGAAQFAITAQGSAPLSYQWFFNDLNLPEETNAQLTLSNVTSAEVGAYFAVVSNAFGVATSGVAQLTVVFPPEIVQSSPDGNINITNGSTVTFSVFALGTPPITYQWLFNGSLIPGATNPIFSLTNITFAQSGTYFVSASNAYGTMIKTVATLIVVSPPFITQQPSNQIVIENALVTFSVIATGSPPLSYQWYFNETNALADATNALLVLPGVTTNQSGGYSVVVTNEHGSISSTEAELLVLQSNALPVVALVQPTNGSSYAVHQVPVVIDATASDADGSVTQLIVFADGAPLASTTGSSLHFEWLDPTVGSTTLYALATDNQDARGTSTLAQITVGVSTNDIALIPTNAVWRYLDTGVDLSNSWRAIDFDDSGWTNGSAQLGYGDDDEATVVSFGPEATNKFITTYFRRNFVLTDAGSFSQLLLRVLRDDGAVVYLNGVEIFRSNMATGGINYATLAVNAVAGAAENAFFSTNVSPDLLVNGTNVVAVEVHQVNGTSTDLSFDLALLGTRSFAPRILAQPESQIVFEHSPVSFAVGATGGKPLTYQWYFNQTNLLVAETNTTLALASVTRDDEGGYSVIVSNAFGTIQSTTATLTVLFSNNVPQVNITSPTNGASFPLNQPIRIEAIATDDDGSIAGVEFYAGDSQLGAAMAEPFQFDWLDARAGLHLLSAVAIDNDGGRATSAVVEIQVTFSTNAPVLVMAGAVWKYLDTGTNAGTLWRNLDFDDGAWLSGPAELGYGDGGEATVVSFGPSSANKFVTTYFRKQFILTDSGSFTNVLMRLVRDDGAIVYLNETEVLRNSMPTGTVTFTTLASATIGGAAETQFISQAISPGALHNGTNVIAVEIHQAAVDSSDVSFNLELRAQRFSPPVILTQPQDQFVSTNGTATFSVSAVGTEPLHFQWFFNETNLLAAATNTQLTLSNVSTEIAGAYSVAISNAFGTLTSAVAILSVLATNNPPTIVLVQPADGATLPGHIPVIIEANANDSDGALLTVEFFADDALLGQAVGAPYRFEWLDAMPGTHQVWAVVTDQPGARATSAVAQITVAFPTNLTRLISTGAVWRYLDTGTNLGTNWRSIDFDSQLWPSGPAELGYGDESEGRPEATVVSFGTNANNKHITTYFRRAFTLNDTSSFGGLLLRLLRDDGAVVYLNGSEVFRSNLPTGEVTFATLALTAISGSAEAAYISNSIPAGLLRMGTNVVAAEMHQSSANSTDLSFDLELLADRRLAPQIVNQPQNRMVLPGGTATFAVTAVGSAPLQYQWFFNATNALSNETNDTLVLTNVAPAFAGAYSVLVSNNHGAVTSAPAVLSVIDSNPPPVVTLTQPTNGEPFDAGVSITLQASANDPGGAITNVEFFADGVSLSADTTPPYEFQWDNAAPGIHAAWAIAFDDFGSVSTSAVVHILVNSALAPAQTLVATGSVWRYLDDGTDQSNVWRMIQFDDAAWGSGPAHLGYGDGDEATVLSFGTNSSRKFPTYYFRHVFVVSNATSLTELPLRLLRDDGAVVYLNDVEVFRSNMPQGPITFDTFAAGVVAEPAEDFFFDASIDPASLVEGTNLLAVEVHQINRISSDISFDLELVGRILSRPVIAAEPQSQTVTNGSTVQFEVMAIGTEPLFYQWYFNFTNALPDGTNAALVLTDVNTNHAGTYVVAVSSADGVVFSAPATLDVVILPPNVPPTVSLTSPPDQAVFFQGSVITISADAVDSDGTIARVEFFDGDTSLAARTNAPFIFDWVNASLGQHALRAVATDDRGGTGVSAIVHILMSSASPPPASNVTLIATGAVWKYLDTGVDQGSNWIAFNFDDSSWLSGPAELGYGDAPEGRPEATVIQFGPSDTNKYPTYYFRHAFEVTNAAGYSDLALSVMRDDGVVVYLNGIEVWRDNLPAGPISFTNYALLGIAKNDEATFLTTHLSPQLLLDGTNVVAVEIHQVNGPSTDVSFDLQLSVTQPIAPVIAEQPSNQVASAGQTVPFRVRAVGTPPLFYQWFFNNFIALPGATNATLILSNVQSSDEGSYSVLVSNHLGSVQSAPALLTISAAPQIINGPQDAIVASGGSAQFSATAVGAEPLIYQWLFNGTNEVTGATSATLVLTNITAAQAGLYALRVTNFVGSVTSAPAILRVLITTELESITRVGADFRLVFGTVAGLRYTVEFTDSLTQPEWNGIPGLIKLPGTGEPLTVDVVNAGDERRFLRIRVE